ncbi:MAG: hypothetical protein IPH88_08455 [Bacteroidales bacterium]|nr:hypothetical protein [Bacteroidales bacterium]
MKLFLRILLITLWTAFAAGSVVLMSFANQTHEVKPCTGVEIRMKDAGIEPLFTAADIKSQLTGRFGKFDKKSLDEIDLKGIISFLRSNPNIDVADAHLSIEGKLMVDIQQCKPIVRIISETGREFYIDSKGKILPANPAYPARVIVANGSLNVPLKPGKNIFTKQGNKPFSEDLQRLQGIYSMAGFMKNDSVMDALVEQIYVKADGNYRLATRTGFHIIEFGDTSETAEKIENLKAFYKYGLTRTGWTKYRIINLTYKNQVVCTK